MITLQADPLVEWNEEITTLSGQTSEAQAWVGENILNTEAVKTMETVHSTKEDVDWDRIASQLYTAEGFTLDVVRVYRDTNSCATNPSGTTHILATV